MINLFKLEKTLIPLEYWSELEELMPKECKQVVNSPQLEPVGIGYTISTGWYVLASCGQGPMLQWIETDD